MFKSVLFVALCVFVLAECQPTKPDRSHNSEAVRRAPRCIQFIKDAVHMAGQIANRGIDAAKQEIHIISSAAQKAVDAGASIAARAAKSVVSRIIVESPK